MSHNANRSPQHPGGRGRFRREHSDPRDEQQSIVSRLQVDFTLPATSIGPVLRQRGAQAQRGKSLIIQSQIKKNDPELVTNIQNCRQPSRTPPRSTNETGRAIQRRRQSSRNCACYPSCSPIYSNVPATASSSTKPVRESPCSSKHVQ
jgi:hypothetical protein